MKKTRLASFFVTVGLLGANEFARTAEPVHPDQPIISPAQAIAWLKEGNGVDSGEVRVIGAYYNLDTGAVSFLDEK
jgi:hypothetical protein